MFMQGSKYGMECFVEGRMFVKGILNSIESLVQGEDKADKEKFCPVEQSFVQGQSFV